MALNSAEKKQIVSELSETIGRSVSIIAADYRGLTVAELDALRAEMRQVGVTLRVARNTLSRIALQDTPYAGLQDSMVGPIILAFSHEDPAAAARVFKKFVKSHEQVAVKAISLDGQMLEPSALTQVADLPTREQALSMLLSVFQAPITKVAQVLNGVNTKLVRTVAAVGDAKS